MNYLNKEIDKALSKKDLIEMFEKLGIRAGMTLEVHVSMKKFGYIIGGSQTFNDALIELLGYNGTIVMPMHSPDYSEPSLFENPPVAYELQEKYRDNLPAFDKDKTDLMFMSKVYENMRRRPKTLVSGHPNSSYLFHGKYAKLLSSRHSLDFSLGENSPNKMLFGLKGYCLLAGCDFDNMTSLHLAEYVSGIRPVCLNGSKILENDKAVWKKYLDIELDSDEFLEIGRILEDKHLVRTYREGDLVLKLVRIDTAVIEGVKYFKEKYK